VAALWDEVRTALTATQISERDQLFEATVLRFVADREPASMRVLLARHGQVEVLLSRPFVSLSGDSLSSAGYWRDVAGDSVEYHAPDADALSSNAFLRDHCFALASVPRNRAGMVGLAFEPVRQRRLPDIAGTIWLDAVSFELRLVEYRYTRLPPAPNAVRSGGEVHFSRLANGAWIVRRWFIRMPQFAETRGLPRVYRFREAGGDVAAPGLEAQSRPAIVMGTVRDSSGRALPNALVRLIGTRHTAVTDQAGSYRLDSLPVGNFTVAVQPGDYDLFSVIAAQQSVNLSSGTTARVNLRTLSMAEVSAWHCGAQRSAWTRSALLVTVLDSASSLAISGTRLRLIEADDRSPGEAARFLFRPSDRLTDGNGFAAFCAVPPGVPIELALISSDSLSQHVMTLLLRREEVSAHVIRVRRNTRTSLPPPSTQHGSSEAIIEPGALGMRRAGSSNPRRVEPRE
jgi:hypothetical protein